MSSPKFHIGLALVLVGAGYLAYPSLLGHRWASDEPSGIQVSIAAEEDPLDEETQENVVDETAEEGAAQDLEGDTPAVVDAEPADAGESEEDESTEPDELVAVDDGPRPEPEMDDEFLVPDGATGGGPPITELEGVDMSDLPARVKLKRSVRLTNREGKERFVLPDRFVKPEGIVGSTLMVSMDGNAGFRGELLVRETDLLDQLDFRNKVKQRIDELGLQYAGLDKELSETDFGDSDLEIALMGEEALDSLVREALGKDVLDEYPLDAVTLTTYEGRSFIAGQGVFEVLDVEFLHDTIFGKEKINLWALVRDGELRGWAYGGDEVIIPIPIPGQEVIPEPAVKESE